MDTKGYSLIYTIVNKGYSEEMMIAARAAGAKGGTIIAGRGTGTIESDSILGMEINPEKEIVLILAENSQRQEIMKAIYKAVGLNTEGSGFSFSLPVEDIIGSAALTKTEES